MENRFNLIKILLYILTVLAVLICAAIYYLKPTIKPSQIVARNLPTEHIRSDKKIANCKTKTLKNKILLITSRYCPHCKEAKETLIPIINQCSLTNNFQILDIINKEDAQTLNDLGIIISGVPVLIVNCQAYVGTKSVDQYQDLLIKFCISNKTGHNL